MTLQSPVKHLPSSKLHLCCVFSHIRECPMSCFTLAWHIMIECLCVVPVMEVWWCITSCLLRKNSQLCSTVQHWNSANFRLYLFYVYFRITSKLICQLDWRDWRNCTVYRHLSTWPVCSLTTLVQSEMYQQSLSSFKVIVMHRILLRSCALWALAFNER